MEFELPNFLAHLRPVTDSAMPITELASYGYPEEISRLAHGRLPATTCPQRNCLTELSR